MTRMNSAVVLLCALALTACSDPTSSTASVASLSTGAATNVAANENDQEVLLTWARQGTKAMASNDVAWLDLNLDDRAVFTAGDSTVLTKAQIMEAWKAKDWNYELAETEDVKVQLFGDTAILTGWNSQKATYKGVAVNGRSRFTHTLIKQQGKWRQVAGAESGIIPPK